jgi:hypothetical protein
MQVISSQPPGHCEASTRRRVTLASLVCFVIAGGFATLQVSDWPLRLSYAGELNDIEGMRLVEMLHLRQGIPIYAFPTADRFDASIYGPIYYLLGAKLVDPAAPSVFSLRVISALATIGLAAGCATLAYWLTRHVLAATLAPLIFLSFGFVTRQSISARCDVVAVLLAFLGLLVAFRYQTNRRILLAIPWMVLSIFYKPQYVAGPLAVTLFLLSGRRYRHAMAFMALMGAVVLALLGIFQYRVFPGQAFIHHFLLFNVTPFSWQQFKYAGLMFFGIVLLVPLLMSLEFLRHHPQPLLVYYLACSVLLALITVAKLGSDAHYWLESVLVVSALTSALLAVRISKLDESVALVCLLVVALFFAQFFTRPGPQRRDFERDEAIQQYLRRNFPPRTASLSYWAGDLVRAGLDVPVSDLAQYDYLVRKGTISGRPLLEQIRSRRYGVIATNYDMHDEPPGFTRGGRLPPDWARAILDNYKLATCLDMPSPERVWPDDRFCIWIPRDRDPLNSVPQSQ